MTAMTQSVFNGYTTAASEGAAKHIVEIQKGATLLLSIHTIAKSVIPGTHFSDTTTTAPQYMCRMTKHTIPYKGN